MLAATPCARGQDDCAALAPAREAFAARDWALAHRLAGEARAACPGGEAREILASTAWLLDRPLEALAHWNELGRPLVDEVEVAGAPCAWRPRPGELLRPGTLVHWSREYADARGRPATARYLPAEGGRARVWLDGRQHGASRPVPALLRLAAGQRTTVHGPGGPCRATLLLEARVHPARHGGALRVARAHRELAVRLERERYRDGQEDQHGRLVARWARWVRPQLELSAHAGMAWVESRGGGPAGGFGLRRRSLDEGLELGLAAGVQGPSPRWLHGTAHLEVDHRPAPAGPWARLRVEARAVDGAAPRILWPGVDTGSLRALPLRAHDLAVDGRIDPARLAPRLVAGSVELGWTRRWKGAVEWGPVAFVDRAEGNRGQLAGGLTDAGAGLRLGLLDQELELYWAHSLDGDGDQWGLRLAAGY